MEILKYIIGSILLNLAATYLKPGVDLLWAKFSQSKKRQNAEKLRRLMLQVASLQGNPIAIIDLRLDLIELRRRQHFFWLVTSVFLISSFTYYELYSNQPLLTVSRVYRLIPNCDSSEQCRQLFFSFTDAVPYILSVGGFISAAFGLYYTRLADGKQHIYMGYKQESRRHQSP
jgi:hypothetical protein